MTAKERFWDFSNRIYQREAVQQACLQLQNQHDLDVNMLLFCIWSGIVHGELADALFGQALQVSLVWRRRLVHPLRQARSWMKTELASVGFKDDRSYLELREQIKLIELKAERLQQLELERLVDRQPAAGFDQTLAIVQNLKRYCHSQALDLDPPVAMLMAVLIEVSVPGENLESALLAMS
jgi:uncharacterized protein (TIGR02444 family)